MKESRLLTKNDVQEWLKIMLHLIIDIHISLNNANRLKENKYAHEESLKNNGFFKHYFNQMKFLMAIQISKLLSESRQQYFSFNKLLDELEQRKYSDDLLEHMNSQKVMFGEVFRCKDDVIQKVVLIRNEISANHDLIKKLTSARDRYYAHSDKVSDIELPISSEYAILANLCADIYNIIDGGFFNNQTMFSLTNQWNIDWLIYSASELKVKRLNEIKQKL